MGKGIMKSIGEKIVKNKSTILLYTQAAGVPLAMIAAACAVPAYEEERKALMDEVHDDLTWCEEGKIFFKHFWKAGLVLAGTEISIFVKDSWDREHIATLAALVMSQENNIKEIKESIVKTVGDKKAAEVQQTYANCKKSDEKEVGDLNEIVNAQIAEAEKPYIWQDLRFDTGYFLATRKEVEDAVRYVERQVAGIDTVTVSAFKDMIHSKTSRETDCCGFSPRDIAPDYGVPQFKIDGVKQLTDGTIIHLIDYNITWVDGEYLVESEYD